MSNPTCTIPFRITDDNISLLRNGEYLARNHSEAWLEHTILTNWFDDGKFHGCDASVKIHPQDGVAQGFMELSGRTFDVELVGGAVDLAWTVERLFSVGGLGDEGLEEMGLDACCFQDNDNWMVFPRGWKHEVKIESWRGAFPDDLYDDLDYWLRSRLVHLRLEGHDVFNGDELLCEIPSIMDKSQIPDFVTFCTNHYDTFATDFMDWIFKSYDAPCAGSYELRVSCSQEELDACLGQG